MIYRTANKVREGRVWRGASVVAVGDSGEGGGGRWCVESCRGVGVEGEE